jgi:hypothetical protein
MNPVVPNPIEETNPSSVTETTQSTPAAKTNTPPAAPARRPAPAAKPKKAEESSSNPGLIIALVLLALVGLGIGYTAWTFMEERDAYEAEAALQKENADKIKILEIELKNELANAANDIELYKNRSEELDQLLADAQQKLETRQRALSKLTREKASIESFKQELEETRSMNASFQEQIAALLDEVDQLKGENSQLKETIASLENEKNNLSNKVASGAALQAHSIIAEGQKKQRGDKFSLTPKARATDRISVSFVLAENNLAPQGEKSIHLVITTPSGKTLSDPEVGAATFSIKPEGQDSEFTRQKDVSFDGTKQKVFFNWEKTKKYEAGTYKVAIFADGVRIGTSQLVLK